MRRSILAVVSLTIPFTCSVWSVAIKHHAWRLGGAETAEEPTSVYTDYTLCWRDGPGVDLPFVGEMCSFRWCVTVPPPLHSSQVASAARAGVFPRGADREACPHRTSPLECMLRPWCAAPGPSAMRTSASYWMLLHAAAARPPSPLAHSPPPAHTPPTPLTQRRRRTASLCSPLRLP